MEIIKLQKDNEETAHVVNGLLTRYIQAFQTISAISEHAEQGDLAAIQQIVKQFLDAAMIPARKNESEADATETGPPYLGPKVESIPRERDERPGERESVSSV